VDSIDLLCSKYFGGLLEARGRVDEEAAFRIMLAALRHDFLDPDRLDLGLVLGRVLIDHDPPRHVSTVGTGMACVAGQVHGEKPVEVGVHLGWRPGIGVILTGTLALDLTGVSSVLSYPMFSPHCWNEAHPIVVKITNTIEPWMWSSMCCYSGPRWTRQVRFRSFSPWLCADYLSLMLAPPVQFITFDSQKPPGLVKGV